MNLNPYRYIFLAISVSLLITAGCSEVLTKQKNPETSSCSPRKQRTILYVFTAEWCGPCQRLKGTLRYPKVVQYLKCKNIVLSIVDIDQQRELARRWKIYSVPTCILINSNEKQISRFSGYRTPDNLIHELERFFP